MVGFDHGRSLLSGHGDGVAGDFRRVTGYVATEKRVKNERVAGIATEVVEGADILILPLPATKDGVTVHCPRDPACIVTLQMISELMEHTPRLLMFGGRIPAEFLGRAMENGVLPNRVTDYYDSEVLQLRNAYLTAEAALMTAMELTDHAIRGAKVAVLGYGRIGK